MITEELFMTMDCDVQQYDVSIENAIDDSKKLIEGNLKKETHMQIGKVKYTILCIDDDASFLLRMKKELADYEIVISSTIDAAIRILRSRPIHLVLLDISLESESGLDGLKTIKLHDSDLDVIMVSKLRMPEYIVEAMRLGASDYICKPIMKDELIARVEKVKKAKFVQEKYNALLEELDSVDPRSYIVGKSYSLVSVLKTADKLKGHHNANVLIQGESGTGKELLARYVHRLEENSKRPMIVVNCAAIPENLVESELFGHEKGSFTGAMKKKIGKFALADGGDIFLDEIGCLKHDIQTKLLRVLQEKEFSPVGSNDVIKSEFRVIAATNDNLEQMIIDKSFRLDLYHRLAIINLKMPSLHERKQDIGDLVVHFIHKYCAREKIKQISNAAIQKLEAYSWPGNIRELENVIHNAIILSNNDCIEQEDITLPTHQNNDTGVANSSSSSAINTMANLSPLKTGIVQPLKELLAKVEKTYLEESITAMNGELKDAAKHLGIGVSTLYKKIK